MPCSWSCSNSLGAATWARTTETGMYSSPPPSCLLTPHSTRACVPARCSHQGDWGPWILEKPSALSEAKGSLQVHQSQRMVHCEGSKDGSVSCTLPNVRQGEEEVSLDQRQWPQHRATGHEHTPSSSGQGALKASLVGTEHPQPAWWLQDFCDLRLAEKQQMLHYIGSSRAVQVGGSGPDPKGSAWDSQRRGAQEPCPSTSTPEPPRVPWVSPSVIGRIQGIHRTPVTKHMSGSAIGVGRPRDRYRQE